VCLDHLTFITRVHIGRTRGAFVLLSLLFRCWLHSRRSANTCARDTREEEGAWLCELTYTCAVS
jgi:hypothetical protein